MSLGYITSDFGVAGDRDGFKTVFLCDEASLPVELPDETVFIFKKDVVLRDFMELFFVFEESWQGVDANFVLFGIGSSDIMKPEKELVLEKKLNTLDFHQVPNRKGGQIIRSFETLISTLRDLKSVKQIISFDPVSKRSSGFHNATVDFIARRVQQNDGQHHHFTSSKRLQLNRRRRKDISENFPCIEERLEDGSRLTQREIRFWLKATMMLLDGDKDDDNVRIEGDFLKVKF